MIMGKGYLEVTIDRQKAARFGVSVEDVQTEIETALGGRVVTYTIEDRDRFPVRVRYARAYREDEDAVKRLLIPARMAADAKPGPDMTGDPAFRSEPHIPACPNTTRKADDCFLSPPWRMCASPKAAAVIKGENGRLLNYVTLNVRGRDAVGFVEDAETRRYARR